MICLTQVEAASFEPLLPVIAGGKAGHVEAVETAAGTTSGSVGLVLDPPAEEVCGDVPAPAGAGGAVVPVAGDSVRFHDVSF